MTAPDDRQTKAGTVDELLDIDAFATEFGDQLNERMKLGWEYESLGFQMEARQSIKQSLRVAIEKARKADHDRPE